MKTWCKPKLMTAYKTIMDSVYIVGKEKDVRGWMAEQGNSPRIFKVKIQVPAKRPAKGAKK